MFSSQGQAQEQHQQEEQKSAPAIASALVIDGKKPVEDDEEKILSVPDEFRCPILTTIMLNPVVAQDGNTYERDAIEKWFKEHNTSPLTGEVMPSKHLVLNRAVRKMIEDFIEKHPEFKNERHVSAPIPIRNQLAELKEPEGVLQVQEGDDFPPLNPDPDSNGNNLNFIRIPSNNLMVMEYLRAARRNQLAEEKEINNAVVPREMLIDLGSINGQENRGFAQDVVGYLNSPYFLSSVISWLQTSGQDQMQIPTLILFLSYSNILLSQLTSRRENNNRVGFFAGQQRAANSHRVDERNEVKDEANNIVIDIGEVNRQGSSRFFHRAVSGLMGLVRRGGIIAGNVLSRARQYDFENNEPSSPRNNNGSLHRRR